MSDIFVSYASADRDRARAVAQALTEQGWSVWWDRTIPPGKQFDEVIEEALDSARCVVVLWSKASVASQWVKTEAAEAMRRKILVPVLIEDVKIPLEFRRLQAADLSTWTGGTTHEELQKFFASIGTNVGQPAQPSGPAPEPRPHAAPVLAPQPESKPVPQPVPQAQPMPEVAPPAPRSRSKAMLLGAAGLASMVVIAVGYTAYNERVKRQEMEARAERERKAAEEARRAAEEAAERAKLAQEAAAKEAAQRRTEQERRAAEDARRQAEAAAQARAVKVAQEEAARAKAAQEAAARDTAAREAAARDAAAREAAARAKAAQEEAARQQQAAARQQQAAAKQGTSSMRINWHDHALRFSGTLIGKSSAASLQVTIYDIKTGAQLGNYDVPATVTKQGEDFIVTGTFQVPKDSVTPHPHSHTSRLLLRRQSDGSLRYIENCPQQGKQCYR